MPHTTDHIREQRSDELLAAGASPEATAEAVALIPEDPITGANLEPDATPSVQVPDEPIVPDVSALPEADVSQEDPLEELEGLESRLSDFDATGRIATKTEPEKRELIEINKRIALHKARTEKEALEARESGVTLGFARGEETEVRREAAVKAMELSALAQAAQGNLALARDIAGQAVKEEFSQLEADIRRQRANIIANFDNMTPEQQARAEETLRRLDAQDEFLQERKANQQEISDIALRFVQQGGSLEVAEEIRGMDDPLKASAKAVEALPAESNTFETRSIPGGGVIEIEKDVSGKVVNTRVVRQGSGTGTGGGAAVDIPDFDTFVEELLETEQGQEIINQMEKERQQTLSRNERIRLLKENESVSALYEQGVNAVTSQVSVDDVADRLGVSTRDVNKAIGEDPDMTLAKFLQLSLEEQRTFIFKDEGGDDNPFD